MLRSDGGPVDSDPPSPDAFALLGNEYRAGIVRALGDQQGTRGPRPVLSFSDLYAAADPDIATSQFNYHLQELVGAFVERTDEGYRLRHEAVDLYRTIAAGTYTRTASLDPFPVGVDCYDCGAPVHAEYADRRFTVACSACERQYSDVTAPPSVVDADRDALLDRIDQYARQRILAFSKGVCSVCANGLDTRLLSGDDPDVPGAGQLDVFVHRSCANCGAQQYLSVGLSQLYDAGLVAVFDRRGVDVTETRIWELPFAMTDRHVTVRSRDPLTAVLRVEADGEELELVVSGD